MKYLKITLLWEKRALFGQILQGTMSDYGALISFGLFLGIVVENVEILLVTSTKIYYLTLILSFFKFIFRFYHLYIVCSRLFHERTFLFNQFASHSRKSRVEKIMWPWLLWHLALFLFRFAVNVKGLHIVCTPPFLLGGRLNFQPSFQKEGGLAEPQLFLFRFAVNVKSLHILCTPSLSAWTVELPTKFSKRGGGLVGPQLLERVAGKEGMTFLMGAMQFSHIKN